MRLYEGAADAPALLTEDGTRVDYGRLPELIAPWCRELDTIGGKGLAVLFAEPDMPTVAGYLACLATGTAVLLADPRLTDAAVARLADAYQPELMLRPRGTPPEGYRTAGPDVWRRASRPDGPVHENTAVLMTTSGSTGAPRAVRLSYRNIEANASAIADSLGITEADRAITSLPLHYCYGLSVLNSHLVRGAPVVLTAASPTGRRFWRSVTRLSCTSFAGVPLAYEALLPMLSRDWPPSMRSLTQAGGALSPSVVTEYARLANEHDARFFVMYGQTEATARMTVLDTTRYPDRIGTVGTVVPGGRLRVEAGEIVYTGPNVMLGYADSRGDLAADDQLLGTLRTGDLGTVDAEGFLTLRGRLKRIVKVAGRRISLDEVEQSLGGGVAAVAADTRVVVYHTGERADLSSDVARLCARLGVPTANVRLVMVPGLPTTGSHKIDYPTLAALAAKGTP